jgi:hypothetical protein
MDNTRDLPGYKHYVDPETGERPAVHVAYLDLVEDPATTVNGVAFRTEDIAALDARERNYDRREVTTHVSPPTGGSRVWAYFGTNPARLRFDTGQKNGTAVVSREYIDGVRQGFARLGPHHLALFDDSTDPPPIPIRNLRRIDTAPS